MYKLCVDEPAIFSSPSACCYHQEVKLSKSRTCQRAACRRKSEVVKWKSTFTSCDFLSHESLFSHNTLAVSHYYSRFTSSPSSLCPSKDYLTNILPEVACIGGRSILCCSFATATPASCIHGSVCLSVSVYLVNYFAFTATMA